MSDNIIELTREEVIAIARCTKNEIENLWNGLLSEISLRGKTNLRIQEYIEMMKKKLDRLETIVHDEKIRRFENDDRKFTNDDPMKTINCPSVFVTGEKVKKND